MGSPDGVEAKSGTRYDEIPQHRVNIPSFSISKYPITWAQYQVIMIRNPSTKQASFLKARPNQADYPVKAPWHDAQEFCQELTLLIGQIVRLPSEAEWEYAARGGNQSNDYTYSGSNNLDEVAWYRDNSRDKRHPVGCKKPNELGIYDMSGNVLEWCEDIWYKNYNGAPTDGSAWISEGFEQIIRGGSWDGYSTNCRSCRRNGKYVNEHDIGFRVVLPLSA